MNESTSWTERLLMIADAFQNLDPQTRKFLGGGVGMDEGSILLLSRSREALTAMAEQQRKTNILTEEAARLAEKEQEAWRALEDRFNSLARQVKNQLTPGLIEAADAFGRWLDLNRQWIETDVVGTIGDVAQAFQDLGTIAGPVLSLIAEGWKNIFSWTHAIGEDIRKEMEERKAVVKRDGKDEHELGRGIAHVLAFFGDEDAQAAINAERRGLGLSPLGSAGGGSPSASPTAQPSRARGNTPKLSGVAAEQYRIMQDELNDARDPAVRASLQREMDRVANGTWPGPEPKATRGSFASSLRGALARGPGSVGGGGTTVQVDKIADTIVVQTQATDARGISSHLGPLLRNHIMSAQGASGMK